MSHTQADGWDALPVKATAVGIVGDQGATFTVYETNWKCPACDADNHARRQRCLRCKGRKPEDASGTNVVATPELSKFLGQGALEWREALDPASNQLYYHNPKTGESQWARPAELGATPMASGWFGRGAAATNSTQRSLRQRNEEYMKRPARVQVVMGSKPKFNVEGNQEYNIWYGKFIGENWKGGGSRDPADSRCDPDKDAGATRARAQNRGGLFCIHFARGSCGKGKDCSYFHRLPEPDDELRIGDATDIFGRERHKDHREDMDGVGSFHNPSRTLYCGGLNKEQYPSPAALEKAVRKHFEAFGEVEHINVVTRICTAFVRYRNRSSAEFAKEALRNQALDHGEILNVRWARDDPNPVAQEAIRRADMDAAMSMLQARGMNLNHSENPHLEVPAHYALPAAKRPRTGEVGESDELLYPNTDDQYQGGTHNALTTTGEGAGSDSEWTKVWDENYKRHYFYNTKTGATTWTDPAAATSQEATGDAEHQRKADDLQDASSDAQASERGTQASQATSATPGLDAAGAASTPAPGAAGEARAAEATSAHGDATPSLPSPWQLAYDANYQREYFYNPETKASSWERPT